MFPGQFKKEQVTSDGSGVGTCLCSEGASARLAGSARLSDSTERAEVSPKSTRSSPDFSPEKSGLTAEPLCKPVDEVVEDVAMWFGHADSLSR